MSERLIGPFLCRPDRNYGRFENGTLVLTDGSERLTELEKTVAALRKQLEQLQLRQQPAEQPEKRDAEAAARWYKEGNRLYWKKQYTEATALYRKAAEQDHAAAQCNLGWCYENGRGVEKDVAEAAKWYRKAAEQGNAAAQYNLGVLLP